MLIVCPACSASYRLTAAALGEGRSVRCARCRTEWYATPEAAITETAPEVRPEPAPEVQPGAIGALDDDEIFDAIEAPRHEPAEPEIVEAEAVESAPPPRVKPKSRFSLRRGPSAAKAAAAKKNAPASAAVSQASAPRVVRPPRKIRAIAVATTFGAVALVFAVLGRVEIVRSTPSLASLYAAFGLPVNVRGLSIEDVKSVEEIEDGVPILLVTGTIGNISKTDADVPRLRVAVRSADDRELYAWTTMVGRTKLPAGQTARFTARLASPPAEGRDIAVRFLTRLDLAAHASR